MLIILLITLLEIMLMILFIAMLWYLLWTFALKSNPLIIEFFDLDKK